MYNDVYRSELIQARLLSVFTFIALFICSMGLLGMSLLLTQRKVKEIGIRKVNGASSGTLIQMLNWQLLKWVMISLLLAAPIAFFAMNQWLENFAYKTNLAWWIFALAGFIAIAVAFATVSLNTWRAARRNPVESLRYE
jgi:putative ABC transport system permease protein